MKDSGTLRRIKASGLLVALILAAGSVSAHHGSSISYNVSDLWTTWATVTEFNYKNPHPTMTFDRTTGDGEVEHWFSELLTNPSMMARQGWTRKRSIEELTAGTRVKLYIGTARAGGFSGIVMKLEDEHGNEIGGRRGEMNAVDLDGVPGGLQPTVDEVLPGQASQ